MKKIVLAICGITFCPEDVWAQKWELSQSGMAGVYYGVTQTRENHNIKNMPNRTVFRADGNVAGTYVLSKQNRVGVQADYTIVLRQHDANYGEGDWRFYPYALAESNHYGKVTVGYTYNAAYLLHQGAQEISWIGIKDSNLTYFLSDVNWSNGFKSVKFVTPKSTYIMDDGRAVKFSYFSPEIGNTKIGMSYTPDNAHRRGMVSRYVDYEKTQDGYSVAMQNSWYPGLGELKTSIGYGLFNRTDKEWAFGARWKLGKFNIAASYKKAYIDGDKNPISTVARNSHLPAYFDNYREGQAWDFSIGYDFGRFKTNLAYLHTEANNTRNRDDLVVQSNRFYVNEAIELFWINGYLNSKGFSRSSDNNNKGYASIAGVALKF